MTCAFITAAILFICRHGMEVLRVRAALARTCRCTSCSSARRGAARRMVAFIDPFADPQGAGFHIIQSLIAVGTGGSPGRD